MFEFRAEWLDMIATGSFARQIIAELRSAGISDSAINAEMSVSVDEIVDLDRTWCYQELCVLLRMAQQLTGRYLIFKDPKSVGQRLAVGTIRLGASYADDVAEAIRFLSLSAQTNQRFLDLSTRIHGDKARIELVPNIPLGDQHILINYYTLITLSQMLRFLISYQDFNCSLFISDPQVNLPAGLTDELKSADMEIVGTNSYIQFPSSLLSMPMPEKDASRFSLALQEVTNLAGVSSCRPSWGDKVRVCLLTIASDLSAGAVADELNLTPRTLSSYLQREGLSFTDLRSSINLELQSLVDSKLPSTSHAKLVTE